MDVCVYVLMVILSEIKGLRFVAGVNSNCQCMRLCVVVDVDTR